MIRELFMAFVLLSLTVAAVAWYSGGSRLSVQQVEASLAPAPMTRKRRMEAECDPRLQPGPCATRLSSVVSRA
jgi:hypothetical protein